MATARRTSGWLYSYRSRTQNSKSPARADGLIHRLSWAGDRKHPAQSVNKPGEPIQGGFRVPTGWLPDGLRVASGWPQGGSDRNLVAFCILLSSFCIFPFLPPSFYRPRSNGLFASLSVTPGTVCKYIIVVLMSL